jgi:hypothetical protein
MNRRAMDKVFAIVKNIAGLVVPAIHAKVSEKRWKIKDGSWDSAYIDIRWTAGHEFSISKLRVVLPNGRVFARVRIPHEAIELFRAIRKTKESVFPEKWYGLKLTIYQDRTFNLEYNLDSECITDPHFWDPA